MTLTHSHIVHHPISSIALGFEAKSTKADVTDDGVTVLVEACEFHDLYTVMTFFEPGQGENKGKAKVKDLN